MNLIEKQAICLNIDTEILQDYLELRMEATYGPQWIHTIIDIASDIAETQKHQKNYVTKILNINRKHGENAISKQDMDISCINVLIHQPEIKKVCDCWPKKSDRYTFSRFFTINIYPLFNDRNNFQHSTTNTDRMQAIATATDNLFRLIKVLQSDHKWDTPRREDFLQKYKKKISLLYSLLSDDKTNLSTHSIMFIDEKTRKPLANVHANLTNTTNIEIASWDVTQSPEMIHGLSNGTYMLTLEQLPIDYVPLNHQIIHVTNSHQNLTIPVQRKSKNHLLIDLLDDPALYKRAFNIVFYSDPKDCITDTMLSAFMLTYGLGVRQNKVKGKKQLDRCSQYISPDKWPSSGIKLSKHTTNKNCLKASAYFMAVAILYNDAKAFYNAGKKMNQLGNYEIGLKCFEQSGLLGFSPATKIFQFESRIGKQAFKQQFKKQHALKK